VRRDHGHIKNARAWNLSSDVNMTTSILILHIRRSPYIGQCLGLAIKIYSDPQRWPQPQQALYTTRFRSKRIFFVAHLEIASSTLAVMARRRLDAILDIS
jgi:hypothetical protein